MMTDWMDIEVIMKIMGQCQILKMSINGQIFVDGTELVEFRVGQVFKNFQSFA